MTGLRSGARGDGCGGPPGLAQPVASPPRSALRHCLGRAAAWTPHPHDRRAGATIASQREASAGAPRCGGTPPDDTNAGVPAGQPPRTGEGPGGGRQRARRRQRSRCTHSEQRAVRSPRGLFHVEHRDALTRCVAQGREPDGRWVSPTGKCMVRRQRHGHRRLVQARALGARVRPATRAGSGGRAGRRSRLVEGTWECHRAENMGVPPRREHRSATAAETPGQQRAGELAGTSGGPSQHRAWSNAERASHRGGVRRTVVERLERRTRTTQTARASTYTAGTV